MPQWDSSQVSHLVQSEVTAKQRKLPVVGIGFVFDVSFLAVIGPRRRERSTDTSLAPEGRAEGSIARWYAHSDDGN